MMFIGGKINHLNMIFIFYSLCSLWAIMSLFSCDKPLNNIPSEKALINSDVTLLWKEFPNANAYNVYVSKSPGVTKLSGYKIANVTNPIRINKLESDKTYYFVVTVVNESGESIESKELSYYAVADKIGLIYWKDLFDKSKEDHESDTAEIGNENKSTPDKSMAESERIPLKNEALSDNIADDKISSVDLAKVNLQSSKIIVVETTDIEEDLTANSKPVNVSIETGKDHNLPGFEEMRLKAAQMMADSHYYIFFDPNSNELSPKSLEKLDRIYQIITNNADANLTLNGYSDSSGAPSINQMISEVRANSVKSYLSGKGIKPSRMMTFGHGSKKSLASNKIAEGKRFNRRVEIELIIP